MTRAPYPAEELQRLFAPERIAIVGVSSRETSFGARFVQNLAHFEGTVDLINPKYGELHGRPCHPSLSALGARPDCVVVATDLSTVEPIFEECIAVGAGGVVMIASGFAETGEAETVAVQSRLARRAAESGVKLVGPNTIGFVNFARKAGATFMTGLNLERGYGLAGEDRRIGFVSQSGALGFAFGQAMERGVGFSHVLTCGNSADVNVADCVSYLIEDPSTRAIACLVEGMADPRQIEAVTRRATAAGKPLVLYKMAKGEEGARAAASHTGNLAGSHDAWRTMVERAGGIFADGVETMLEVVQFLAKAPPPTGPGAVVIATSGGAAIMAADAAEEFGVPLPQPNADVTATLKARIPHFGSARNPCDVTAQVLNDTASFTECAEAVLGQEDFGTLVVPHVLAYATSVPRIALLNELAASAGKPIILTWHSGWLEGPGALEAEAAPHLGLFRSVDNCFRTLALWQRWHARQPDQPAGRVSTPPPRTRCARASRGGARSPSARRRRCCRPTGFPSSTSGAPRARRRRGQRPRRSPARWS
ncbi:CoA-binding protein [Acuticoccus sp.]|uniref:CoA-binding protein n=1 Tax=Acuticoccus sp. TaxID=1904378 RepID=UPI003B51F6DA